MLSLGAGVQSTTLLCLSADGQLPRLDYAVFADTGWEPAAVYAHLHRLRHQVAEPAGIPLLRVSAGSIRNDALNPQKRFASMPLHIRNADGRPGMLRRQCTSEYKIKPIKKTVRRLLGYPHPTPVPKGVFVEQWVGISTDEVHRAKDSGVAYMRTRHPLIDLGWSRTDCLGYLAERGLADTPKSACLGCRFHSNAHWRRIRDAPEEWDDVVAFDAAIREGNARATASGNPLLGQAYLHRSRVPLPLAPIDRTGTGDDGRRESRTTSTDEPDEETGCAPWACRSDDDPPVQDDFGLSA